MDTPLITVLGLVAAALTTGALVPQAVKTWRTRSAGDLSLYMYIMMVSGIMCWLLYGIFIRDLPLILANGIGLILASVILFVKVRESFQTRSRKREPKN